MKNLSNLSSIVRAGALLAVLALVLVVLSSCGGGGGKLTVTPKVNVDVTPPSTLTMAERLTKLGLGADFNFFEAYPDGKFLRVEMKAPAKVFSPGQKSDFGALRVWCKPYMVGAKGFAEKEITSFSEVTFSATAGNPTAGGDELLWQLRYDDVEGITDVSGTVEVLPDVFITGVWDSLNGGVLDSVRQDYGIKITVTDGVVKLSGSNTEWIGWAAAGIIAFCPQVTVTWPVDRSPDPEERILEKMVIEPAVATVYAGATQQFTATAYDQNGEIIYENVHPSWSIGNGGGTISQGVFTAGTATGTFADTIVVQGNYGGVTKYGYATVTIMASPENRPPVAVASANPISGEAPLTVNFDASGSSDPDGQIIEYAWDVDGDLAPDREGMTIQVTFTGVGEYIVTLWVTDDDMISSSDAITITVTESSTEGQTLVAFPSSVTLLLGLGESQEFQIWLKDTVSGSLIRQLDNSELTGWSIDPLVEGENYVTAVPGVITTWRDSGPPDYTILTYATPGQYTVMGQYGELSVTISVTINFA